MQELTATAKAFHESLLLKETDQFDADGYYEFLKVASLSAGIYTLPVGARDPQTPHTEDEIYYALSGRARLRVVEKKQTEDFEVKPGSILFVKAHVPHEFHNITEPLQVLVFFSSTYVTLDASV